MINNISSQISSYDTLSVTSNTQESSSQQEIIESILASYDAESLSEDDAADMLQDCPAGGVLITHSPPLGYCDQQEDGTHEGSQVIRDIIKVKRPVLNLCGHIHEAWNTTAMIGQTQVFNLGPTAHWFEI